MIFTKFDNDITQRIFAVDYLQYKFTHDTHCLLVLYRPMFGYDYRASLQVTTATVTLSTSWKKKLDIKAKRQAAIALEQEMRDRKRQEIEVCSCFDFGFKALSMAEVVKCTLWLRMLLVRDGSSSVLPSSLSNVIGGLITESVFDWHMKRTANFAGQEARETGT